MILKDGSALLTMQSMWPCRSGGGTRSYGSADCWPEWRTSLGWAVGEWSLVGDEHGHLATTGDRSSAPSLAAPKPSVALCGRGAEDRSRAPLSPGLALTLRDRSTGSELAGKA